MDTVAAVSAIPISYTSSTQVVYKTYEGKNPGDVRVIATTYEVTVYDKNGKLETVTNTHQADYKA